MSKIIDRVFNCLKVFVSFFLDHDFNGTDFSVEVVI